MLSDAVDRFPGFELKQKLRETRCGVWYRAYQTRIGRDVLIKAPAVGDLRAIEALRREVQLLGQISGAGFVTLYDFRADGDRSYAVYEWPGSKSLQGRARSTKRVDVSRTLGIAASIVRIVQSLHEKKYWLRRATPDDFFFDLEGKLQLVNLESLEPHLGKNTGSRISLWCHPAASGYVGDLFLIGLHLHFLATGKTPVPRSIIENPGRWLESFVRTPSTDPNLLRATRVLLGDLWKKDSDLVLRDVMARLTESSTHGVEPRWPGRWMRGSIIAAALFIGVLGGVWIWPHLRQTPSPTTASDPDQEELVPADTMDAALLSTTPVERVPETPPRDVEGHARESDPVAEVAPVEVVDVESPASAKPPTLTGGAVAVVKPDPPVTPPLPAVPATIEGPLAELRTEWQGLGKDAFEWSKDHERVRDLGLELVRALGKNDTSPWPDRLAEVLQILVDVEELAMLLEVRKDLFATLDVQWDGARFRANYDFSTRRHLRDWIGLGEASRVSSLDGRLFVLGTVRYQPARWFLDVPKLRVEIPADGFDSRRPNINIVLGARENPDHSVESLSRRWTLFGLGTYFGNGSLEKSGSADKILLPSLLVLERNTPPSSSDDWRVVWADDGPWHARQKHVRDGSTVEFACVDNTLKWRIGDWTVRSDADSFRLTSQHVGALRTSAGSRLDLLLETFQSTLAVERMTLTGEISVEALRSLARSRALEGLQKGLPDHLHGLLR